MYLVIVALVLLSVALCGLHFGSDHHDGVSVAAAPLALPVAGGAFVLVLAVVMLGAFGVIALSRASGIPPPGEPWSALCGAPLTPSLFGANAPFAPIRC